ncbi:restriction endonuclease subunit S [Tardiphaga sp. vice278]|uniref:restriction endonuclease subunit S n=1 Tax=Tardiphaga sp. vice278 TaxID=2592815 RepID=UPI001162488B|nr:restriction endonuclease subunit S [Tardiphaga sp. vice278]QDM15472.1 restriction endonuclease subunit S [Tardiphaga sp. vice278]
MKVTVNASANWSPTRLRFVARLNPSKSEISELPSDREVSFLPMEAIGEDGSLRLDATRPLSEVKSGYSYFRDDDVAVAKITPCFENGKGALMRGLIGGVGFGTTELIVARPLHDQLRSDYLQWIFQSHEFRRLGEGAMYGAGGQKRVPDDFVRDYRIALPPLPEQKSITAFLDRETRKIDALVEEQRRLIELLKEKRQAVISHAVTKGLDSNAKMKSSGVSWLGDVPENWEIVPLNALFRFVKRQDRDDFEVLSVYRDHGVIPKTSRDDNNNKTPEDLSKYQTVKPGDLVVNKMKAWQGSLGLSNYAGITSPDYAVFEPRHTAASSYLNFLLRCNLLPTVYRSISNGIRPDQWRIEPDKFKELRVPLPPRGEQEMVSSYLSDAASKWDALSTEAEAGI